MHTNSLLLVFYFLTAATTALAQRPKVCGELDFYTCFTDEIQRADYVFEGTMVESRTVELVGGKRGIEQIVRIEKVFKGDLQPGTVRLLMDVRAVLDEVARYVPEAAEGDPMLYPNRDTFTALFRANKSALRRKELGSPVDNVATLEEQFSFLPTMYNLGRFDDVFPEVFRGYLLYYAYDGREFAILSPADLYALISRVSGTRLIDFTRREFKHTPFPRGTNFKH